MIAWGRAAVVGHWRRSILLLVTAVDVALVPAPLQAQWWSGKAPVDFEDCVEKADKTASKDARAAELSQCDSKFIGRRKQGGGYTYFDFMQNRHFDIAGPNPSAEESKRMDEQYAEFLDQRRKKVIAAAFAENQRQRTQASLDTGPALPPARPVRQVRMISETPVVDRPRSHPKAAICRDNAIICGWSRRPLGLADIKKALLGPPARKTHRSS